MDTNKVIKLTCITCPIGCSLEVTKTDDTIAVTGNRCPRGVVYAREETLSPKRVVSATCLIKDNPHEGLYAPARIPVRTDAAFPKEKITELLGLIYQLQVPLPVKRGQVLVSNALETGINVIVSRDLA